MYVYLLNKDVRQKNKKIYGDCGGVLTTHGLSRVECASIILTRFLYSLSGTRSVLFDINIGAPRLSVTKALETLSSGPSKEQLRVRRELVWSVVAVSRTLSEMIIKYMYLQNDSRHRTTGRREDLSL